MEHPASARFRRFCYYSSVVDLHVSSEVPMNSGVYSKLLRQFVKDGNSDGIERLDSRLTDCEEAMTILRAKGYEGQTLSDMVKHVMPATLKHS